MKKFALLLAVLLVLGLFAGCGGSEDPTTAPSTNPSMAPSTEPSAQPTEPVVEYAPENITLIGCRYTQQVTPLDMERITEHFQDQAEQVYVDMLFYISPAYFEDGKVAPSFSAEIAFDDYTYELEYQVETANNTGFEKVGVPATGGYVHMITSVPDAAMEQALEVQYSIGDQQYTCAIEPIAEVDKLDNKTELYVGLKDSIYGGMVEIEVVDICCDTYLVATQGGEDDHYSWFGTDAFVDVILKITNQFTSESIPAPYGYIMESSNFRGTANKVETDQNTKLNDYFEILPNETQYVHVFSAIDLDSGEVNLRINYGGKLYYCTIANTIEE